MTWAKVFSLSGLRAPPTRTSGLKWGSDKDPNRSEALNKATFSTNPCRFEAVTSITLLLVVIRSLRPWNRLANMIVKLQWVKLIKQ